MTLAPSLKSRTAQAADPAAADRLSPWLELGLGIVVIAVPLAFLPMSSAPFVNVKLVLLVLGVMAVWRGMPRTRTLMLPAAAWITAAALAGATGVDRWWSLIGPENSGTGLILLAGSAVLLIAGTATPEPLRARVPVWFVGTCTVVAAVALVDRFAPDAVSVALGGLNLEGGGTLGNSVFLASLMAAGIATAVGLVGQRMPGLVASLVFMSSALALTTKRVGWVALAVALAVAIGRTGLPRRRAVALVGAVAMTLAVWTAIDAFVPVGKEPSGVRRFSHLTSGSAQARLQTLPGLGRAWRKRPLLGWGPGNTWGAHLSSAKASELQLGERGVGDAHNLIVESAVTTGIVGMIPFLVLGGLTIRLMWRGPRSFGWAAGAAAALGVSHLLQPMSLSLTPLLFLFAGLACRAPPLVEAPAAPAASDARARTPSRPMRIGLALVATAALTLSVLSLASSVFEAHGKKYAEEWALRAAGSIAPWRISSAESLALHLAFDGRYGDGDAAREAVVLGTETVRGHPWNPGVRLAVVDVHLLLRDPAMAEMWIRRQRALFPGDPILPGGVQDPSQRRPNSPV